MAAAAAQYAVDVFDVEYLKHGNQPLLARVYRPHGSGPFPLIVQTHGGMWCKNDRLTDVSTDEPLARSGVVVVALDFRMPPQAGYPASLADINYGVRWAKSRAAEWGSRPDLVGIRGASSGGHQAMLAAMRPRDPRYAAIAFPGRPDLDASVRCAILSWPVIDSLGRYQYAQQLVADRHPKLLAMAHEYLEYHLKYWGTEAAMAEGSPTLALERGEAVQMPPVLYMQRPNDVSHPGANMERFIAAYRKAGGVVEFESLHGADSEEAAPQALQKMIAFVHREITT